MNYPRHIVTVAALIRNPAGQVLLVKTDWRGWEFPGGQVEAGEDLPTALAREVQEEAGVIIEINELVAVYSILSEPTKLTIDFTATYKSGRAQADHKETLEVAWVTPAEARERVTAEIAKYRLEWLLSRPHGAKHGAYIKYGAYNEAPFKVTTEILPPPLR